MSYVAKMELVALRQIGWDYWDPIGIRGFNDDDWRGPATDEYDSYMVHVSQQLRNGVPEEQAIAYLDQIASDHMGLGPITTEGHNASTQTVMAIAEYLRR